MRRYGKTGGHIRARIGETFALELPSRPTAGYVWEVSRAPEVAVLKEERMRPGGAAAGATSVQEFEFTAAHAGEGVLVVEYKRPWERTARERIEWIVVVEP
ncbi:MAG: protease inhibitor I42 family protein [bacterium]